MGNDGVLFVSSYDVIATRLARVTMFIVIVDKITAATVLYLKGKRFVKLLN